jgi:hypothetical protein
MGVILILRGLLGLLFGVYLGTAARLSWEEYFVVLAGYLVIDGLAGAVIGIALLRESFGKQRSREMILGIVVLVDAGGRITSGIAIHIWPGIAGFPVTAVLYVAVMAISTTTVGLAEAWLTTREEIARHGPDHQAPQFMAGPVGVTSLISMAFGVASIVFIGTSDIMRLLITGFVAGAGAVSIAMAWSHERMERHRAAALTTTT